MLEHSIARIRLRPNGSESEPPRARDLVKAVSRANSEESPGRRRSQQKECYEKLCAIRTPPI